MENVINNEGGQVENTKGMTMNKNKCDRRREYLQ
jgi:hypothetical protein